jgi:hypothetical protein
MSLKWFPVMILVLSVTMLLCLRGQPTVLLYEPAPRLVHEAHRYHGINFSTLDHETGERYFMRDGKRCQLFTEDFMRSMSSRSKVEAVR